MLRLAGPRPFDFDRDTFAFPNELVWEYRFDAVTGSTSFAARQPPPTYAHRCFVLVRSVRQFLFHATFEPARAEQDENSYRELVREVMRRSPRNVSEPEHRVILPGFSGLRDFSRRHGPLLRAVCGGAWQSYFLRSHWRMVFPISRSHQEDLAPRLLQAVRDHRTPAIHLVRFPQLTINHGVILFDAAEDEGEIRFDTYDPNLPERPSSLKYDRSARTFLLPRNCYWAGGRVDVFEIYCGGLF